MFDKGDRILARAKKDPCWFPATVLEAQDDGYLVTFESGGEERCKKRHVAALVIAPGDRVYCRWKGGQKYFTGKAEKVDGDRIYVIPLINRNSTGVNNN